MKELSGAMLNAISGGTDPNTQLMNNLGNNMAWGAGLAAASGGGIVGAGVGAVGGAVQTVVQGAINHGPVNVPIPQVPMGPSWNGSAGGSRPSPSTSLSGPDYSN
ncbi:hypothetical protein [Serratia plymuthica]|uniref:E492 group microcin n=1 Tax=Serratia plymuthica TaxID=82996 RepID=UPI0009358014|nr:hypothetical protein [Serratia plymuthica]OJT36105.1 microcin [Serratia plymuthica]